jgi:nucleotide-binding universal stress UspA family protein
MLGGLTALDLPGLLDEAVQGSELNADRVTAALTEVFSLHGVGLDIRRSQAALYGSSQPLVDLARLHDLAILPVPQTDSFERHFVEPVLFGSGRPTLLLPSTGRSLSSLETIMLAWDFSREAARALNDALPFLERAKQVHVLTVLGEKHIRTTCRIGELKHYLEAHGISYVVDDIVLKDQTIAECLAGHAENIKANMLVMGAYGHSRLGQFLLGGATRGIRSEPPLPVLLSH